MWSIICALLVVVIVLAIHSLGRWLISFFIGDAPFMVVKDLDMINDIFIKESNKFSGRGVMPSLLHAQQQFIDILGEHADREGEVDINSLCERFTFDVIGKAAFGIDTDVQRNPENPLFKDALAVLPNVNKGVLYHLGQNLYHWPWLLSAPSKLLGAIYANPMAEMTKKAAEVIVYRRKNPQVRIPDMAQMLLDGVLDEEVPEAEKHELPAESTAPLPAETLYQLASNCTVVFIGGFSPENKHSINPTAYQPFGLGPRICLGQRLALAELASATAQVLRHYSISLGKSQKRDLELDTYSVMAAPKEKVFIRLRRRPAAQSAPK
ncbi:hypothetical protein MTO96_032923 [Rhipicephalus appendiculatus]